ncbi:DUF2185 domain-containing protein [Galactobacter sp.]|uniref:immunity protein Imm33 domain-containing protein n=1 Tax=Galactobacter sp. TaxID=2676125 RepID=UPI0025BE878E|nr:DUF2185 domain-containing protein [Galactobacter sp.]
MSQTPQIENAGSCIATATAIGGPGRIRWMLRTPSAIPTDSGWRFYAADDDEENVAHTTRLRVVDFNQVAALDPIIAEVYDAPVGSDYEVLTLEDGTRQVRDAATGVIVAGPGSEPETATEPSAAQHEPVAAPVAPEPAAEPSVSAVPQAPTGPAHAASALEPTAPSGTEVAPASAASAADSAVDASASWLRSAVQTWLSSGDPDAKTALLSELYGSVVLVPVQPDGSPAIFDNQGRAVVSVHSSRQGAQAWQDRIGGQADFAAMTGDEALTLATDVGAHAIVIDPVEVGVEISTSDEFVVGFSRNGKLKHLVRAGNREALLQYLVTDEATGVYLYQAQPGQPAYPLLVTRQSGGEREFALFSSALEVFRYQDSGSAADIPLSWIRANLAEDMYLCIDPGASGGFVEFSPEELASVGFRTA